MKAKVRNSQFLTHKPPLGDLSDLKHNPIYSFILKLENVVETLIFWEKIEMANVERAGDLV